MSAHRGRGEQSTRRESTLRWWLHSGGKPTVAAVVVLAGWLLQGRQQVKCGETAGARPRGVNISASGDWNGDGVDDLVVGVSSWENKHKPGLGVVRVYSSVDGAELTAFHGNPEDYWFGAEVDGTGDLNGDGVSDLLVLTRWSGEEPETPGKRWPVVRAISGKTGKVMYEVRSSGGIMVGDLDADGGCDFIAKGRDPDGVGGIVLVYSGITGKVMGSIQREGRIVRDLKRVGDLDGDKVPDFAVSWESIVVEGAVKSRELVTVVSGKGLSTLWEVVAREDQSNVGGILDGGLDLNGDGVPDVVLIESALRWRNPGPPGAGPGARGVTHMLSCVRALSGRDGKTLWEKTSGPELSAQYRSVCMMEGEQPGDDPVVVVGEPLWRAFKEDDVFLSRGCVWILDGKSGAEQMSIRGRVPGSAFGGELLPSRGANGDRTWQVLVTAHPVSSGVHTVYRLSPAARLQRIWKSE